MGSYAYFEFKEILSMTKFQLKSGYFGPGRGDWQIVRVTWMEYDLIKALRHQMYISNDCGQGKKWMRGENIGQGPASQDETNLTQFNVIQNEKESGK